MKLILASASPRRAQLLKQAGYVFDVLPPEINEEIGLCSNCGPAELVAELAQAKAADVVARIKSDPDRQDAVIVACDTVVECRGHIIGKPHDEEHARQILELLSGCEHRVYTGLCVWRLPAGGPNVRVGVTRLKMDELSTDQLDEYLAGGQWQGKAGAFGYQDKLDWVHIIEGSESNVVGLPMELLAAMLPA